VKVLSALLLFLVAAAASTGHDRTATAQAILTDPCHDPTTACWTRGRQWYEGISITEHSPDWARVRFLNTGPNIPHLVFVIDARESRVLQGPSTAIQTAYASRAVTPLRVRARRPFLAWDVGPVPDGSVVRFWIRVTAPRHASLWPDPVMYGNVTPAGGMVWSALVHRDPAQIRK